MALSQPINTTVVGAVNTYADLYAAFNAGNTALAQTVGSAPPVVVAIDAAGKLAPTTSRDVRADTYLGAASDFLDWVSLAAVPDGMTVAISPANAGRRVVLRHAETSADPDAGTILLADGVSSGDQLVLDAVTKGVVLQRRGIGFYERERHGFVSGASTIGQAAQDFGGYPVTGMRVGVRQVSASSDTLSRGADKGSMKQYAAAATVSLPDPNDQSNPDPTQWWLSGDMVLWEARAASLLFKRWDGAAPANALGHDRAVGIYAQGWVVTTPNPATGNLEWVLTGVTQGPPAGGTTQRTAYWSPLAAPDKTIISTDTSVNTAATLTHPFGAGESWLYLARFGFSGAGTATNSLAKAWGVMQGASDVEMAHTLRAGNTTCKGSYTLLWGNVFGGSSGSQTVRLDCQNVNSGFSTVVSSPLIAALRLETDEAVVVDAGPHTDSVGTFTAAATLSYSSLPSDEYEIVFGVEWNTSGGQAVDLQVSVNGTVESDITAQRVAGRPAFYAGVTSFTLSGTGSVVLQIRRNAAAASGTVTATNATVALLRKGRFQAAASKKASAAATFTSSTMTSDANVAAALQPGWYTLVIGGAQCESPTASGSALCQGQLTQSGSKVGPDWALDVNAGGQWAPTSALTFGVVQPIASTDTLELDGASADGSTAVQLKGACLVALALKPAS